MVRGDRHQEFWDLFALGSWEPGTIDVLERHLGAGTQFIDIGSWIGPLSLFAAALGSAVLAFEPDPVARQEFEDNIALNPDFISLIIVDPRAVGSQDGKLSMVGGEAGLGDSVSRVVPGDAGTVGSTQVQVVDVRTLTHTDAFANCQLMKCDIEGGEYAVIPRLQEYFRRVRPPLLLSLHGYDLLERRARLPRRLHRAWLRVLQGTRRARLLRTIAPYAHMYWSRNARANMRWNRLGRPEKAALAFRLSEAEMYCADAPI